MPSKLHASVCVVASVMSKFVLPSKPIQNNVPNWPNNYKLKGVVLVREDVKVIRRGVDAVLIFVFNHADFPDE